MIINVLKVVKVGVTVASLGLGIAQQHIANKEIDRKIAEKVAEALSKQVKGS